MYINVVLERYFSMFLTKKDPMSLSMIEKEL